MGILLLRVVLRMTDSDCTYGPWEGGHHAGHVFGQKNICYWRMPNIKARGSFGYFNDTTKERVFQDARSHCAVLSVQHGLTKNRYRVVSCSSKNQKWLQVQLSGGHIMECDMEHLSLIQSHVWHALKRPRTVYAQATVNGRPDYFHRIVTNFEMVDHIDRDGLNNRTSNLRKATPKLNARNRRLPRSNTSGHGGISKKPNGVTISWRDDSTGKSRARFFGYKKFGEEGAYKTALNFRIEKETELEYTPAPDIREERTHAIVPNTQKSFLCPQCSLRSAYKSSIATHIKRRHRSYQ